MQEKKNNALEKAENAQVDRLPQPEIIPEKVYRDRELQQQDKRIELAKLKYRENELKAKQKATLKRDRQNQKAQLKEMREKNRQKNHGNGGWLAAVITLGISTLVLASVLTFNYLMPSKEAVMLESAYQKAFYDTIDQVDNMDLNLSKALNTTDKSALQGYLLDLAINSELAENDVGSLPLKDENKIYTTKLINQIGDYAKFLNKKLARGEDLTKEDKQNLLSLYNANKNLVQYLQIMNETVGEDFNFTNMSDQTKENVVIDSLKELENLSTEYPELIYDGPFSDGLDNRELKGLTGNEITSSEALSIFNKTFGGLGLTDVKNDGETSGTIECYNVSAKFNQDMVYAQISKIGGKIIMFEYAGECNQINYNQEHAINASVEFLKSLEIDDMMPVWVNLSNNVYTVNLAYSIQGVPVYSDLVKVRVCADSGKILGMEAMTYYTNHTERVVKTPTLTVQQAQEKVSSTIIIDTARLSIVPIGNSSERLAYEFSGENNGDTYYVYIDAETGAQLQMFKVINSNNGTLLM